MPSIEILALEPDAPEIPLCASWRVEAFGDVLENGVPAEENSLRKFIAGGGDQVALVARRNNALAGMCLLVRSEIEPCHPLSPWLAGLYVTPEHRRFGVGRRLVAAIEDEARARGKHRLYLYTDDAIPYYERLGWRAVERVDWKGFPTALMMRELS